MQEARLICPIPDRALPAADDISDKARIYGLVVWMYPHERGQWAIRFEGAEERLRQFAYEMGLCEIEDLAGG